MPTLIESSDTQVCTRCGRSLDIHDQSQHDRFHERAEWILRQAETARPDQWIVSLENEFGYENREFLPLYSGFHRVKGETCGHQLGYAIGGWWPGKSHLKIVDAAEALHLGLVPAEDCLAIGQDSRQQPVWEALVEALMTLPAGKRRQWLLGRPLDHNLANSAYPARSVVIRPLDAWRRNTSIPVQGWGERLRIHAYEALRTLEQEGMLEEWNRVLPNPERIFRAFDLVPQDAVRVVILGQDPYPNPEDAMGLAFSSPAAKLPASLRNIYKEMADDLGIEPPESADLTHWAYQGVLLANTALTIGADGASHFDIWASFTRTWIETLAASRAVVWVLWGRKAQGWRKTIEQHGGGLSHVIIESAHPSPLSARRGFFGSRPFSTINDALDRLGLPAIDWIPRDRCQHCGGEMRPGIALQSTSTGTPDFPGGDIVTVSPGGPGRIVDVKKCARCGWSRT